MKVVMFRGKSKTTRSKTARSKRLLYERLESRVVLDAGPLVISELMAVNDTRLADADGDFSDWIEIHNPTTMTVNLDGWYLTDERTDLTKWQFPAVSLGPDRYLVVFASAKDTTGPGQLHTNFRLDGDGEYLALVRPDGQTISHAFDPAFPQQREDVSYGVTGQATAFTLEVTGLTYHVPTADDAPSATSWADPDFDDSTWNGLNTLPPILITEAGTLTPDYLEIQNLSDRVMDTSGWVVAVNDASAGEIGAVHQTLWPLPDAIATGEVLYRSDDPSDVDHYFGENIWWASGGNGWIMILDDRGEVVDFVVWGYTPEQIASFQAEINGFQVTAERAWDGPAAMVEGRPDSSLQRVGDNDHDHASDWVVAVQSMGSQNADLSVPFLQPEDLAIGFDSGAVELGPFDVDVEEVMHGVNSSLLARIPFAVEDPTVLDTLQLQIQYNDGFVAYLNGEEIARRNAPASLAWNSAAPTPRSVPASLVPQTIDVSAFLDVLQPGLNVLAIHGLNYQAADANFLVRPKLVATSARYFLEPTPGAPNGVGVAGLVADTKFSVDRGFFETPFQVEITTDTPGAVIRYTFDGSEPGESRGADYTGPIPINRTTTLRAMAFKPDWAATNVDTHTYIFPADVVRQGGMSRTITEHAVWGPQMEESLLDIPTVSLVTPYTISQAERETSIELIFPDGSPGFQLDAGVEHFGGHSLNYPKKSMRVSFKNAYGSPKLNFDLFGGDATAQFDQILLRAGSHDTVFYTNGTRGIYIRNRWISDRQLEMGQPAPHGRYVHLYINGTYWGQYHLMERPNASFMASYFGGEKENYDALNAGSPLAGSSRASWDAMANSTGNYQLLQQYMDVVNYADYMLGQFYSGNDWDWNQWQNWMAARKREPGAGYKFFAWDSDMILRRGLNANVINRGGPGNLWGAIRQHPEFRLLLADRAQKYFFNNGMLTPDRVREDFDELAAMIEKSIIAESARWGAPSGYTPATWQQNINTVKTQIIARRTEVVIEQMRAAGVFPSIDAPTFSQHGGFVEPDFRLQISTPEGTIYYTLDGSDPRRADGGIRGMPYLGPVTIRDDTRLKARALKDGEWSALNEAEFFVTLPAEAQNLIVTELNYNPHDPTPEELALAGNLDNDDFEFIELRNIGDRRITLEGVRFTDGISFDFTGSQVSTLDPGEHVVVVVNMMAAAIRYGNQMNLAGQYTGRLRNEGEPIELLSRSGEPIFVFAYDNGGRWPGRADGKGASLELIDPTRALDENGQPQRTALLEDAANWRSSGEYGGSPGLAGSGLLGDVVLNEVLSHTDLPLVDAIELHNTTDKPVDLGGWYLSDSWGWAWEPSNGNYKKFRIPDGTTIPAGGYLVFDEEDFNPSPEDPLPIHFALNGALGDDVWLMEADTQDRLKRFVDHVEFQAAAEGEPWGRYPNATGRMYPLETATLGQQNSGPRVGPLIISELHYNPTPGVIPGVSPSDLEFVEIYNPTRLSIDLTEWRIRGGIDYDFPAGQQLDPYGTLVVVPFELSEAEKLAAFYAAYWPGGQVPEDLLLLGGYRGQLDDDGERVQLQRPGVELEGFIPRLLEDEVRYEVEPPWPTQANGQGYSLYRVAPDTWGHSEESWDASLPTPGAVPFPLPEAEVVGRRVFYNHSAFDGNDAGVADDAAIAPDKAALMPGQTATFANYTSYHKGINAVMVDIDGVPDGAEPDAGDFQFRVGNSNDPGTWTAAPAPESITIRPGEGVGGSDRVTILWPDNAIENAWLQVTVLATEQTGLFEEDVFYFGNAIGETGNSTSDAKVNIFDMLGTRDNQRNFLSPAAIDFAFDFNRDARVNAFDILIARDHPTHFLSALKLITVPAAKAGQARSSGLALTSTPAASRQTPPGKLAWLHQYEQATPPRPPARKAHRVDEALKELLADERA